MKIFYKIKKLSLHHFFVVVVVVMLLYVFKKNNDLSTNGILTTSLYFREIHLYIKMILHIVELVL